MDGARICQDGESSHFFLVLSLLLRPPLRLLLLVDLVAKGAKVLHTCLLALLEHGALQLLEVQLVLLDVLGGRQLLFGGGLGLYALVAAFAVVVGALEVCLAHGLAVAVVRLPSEVPCHFVAPNCFASCRTYEQGPLFRIKTFKRLPVFHDYLAIVLLGLVRAKGCQEVLLAIRIGGTTTQPSLPERLLFAHANLKPKPRLLIERFSCCPRLRLV